METETLPREALIWDQTFPATSTCGTWSDHLTTLERMASSGYTVVSITIASDPDDLQSAVRKVGQWRRLVAENPDRYLLMTRAEHAEQAQESGRLALGFHFQGTTPFERDLGLVHTFYALGVRHALMAYNQRNHVGDGCHERVDAGLSRFGRELVSEMERVGMIVDVTHTGRRTALDVLEIATRPVIFSHSNAAALTKHQRNIDDSLALACAETGGVVGINGIGLFLGDMAAGTEALFQHLDHWVELLGPQHVGIGLDSVSDIATLAASAQSQASKYPEGQGYERSHQMKVSVPEQIPELTARMHAAGYSETDIRAILGGNWLRLARDIWKDVA